MTLQSNGAMAFGDINVELGVARTTARPLGSAAARALAGVASGAIRTAADFYGKTNILDTFTVTAGVGSLEVVKGNPIVTYGYLGPDYPNFSGGTSPAGSLNDYTFAPTNSTIEALAYFTGDFTSQVEFWVAGQHPNSGWNTMTVYHNYTGTTTVFNRTDFGFDSNPASEGVPAHTWWIIGSSNIFSNTTGGQNTYLITIT